MWVTDLSPATSPCSHLSRMGKERGCPVWVSSCPFTHPTSAVSPCIVQAVCLEKLLRTTCCMGLPGLAFPVAWSCLLSSVLAMSRLAWCPGHSLYGGMTQQETFPKQACVESLTACGLGHISLVGAPLALFLLKQERQLLSPACPIDMAAGLTSVSSYVHGVSMAMPAWQLWVSPHLRPVSPVICAPGTSLRERGLSHSRGCFGPSCRDNTGG